MPLDRELESFLKDGVSARAWTAAAVAVVHRGALVADVQVPSAAAVFDIASVTKVATASLALLHLDPDEQVPWLAGAPRVSDLLAHRSGLPAWRPFFAHAARELDVLVSQVIADAPLQAKAREIARTRISETQATAARPTYSDLNFLSLGFLLEERTGRALPQLARESFFAPLGLSSMQWGGERADAVPTGAGRPRPGNPQIEIDLQPPMDPGAHDHAADDDNAASMGGRCGHAGIWSTARDVALLGEALRQSAEGEGFLPRERALAMLTRADGAGSRTLGLDTPSGDAPSIGRLLGRGSLGAAGHLGFTGTSLWIDRDAQLSVAFLSNAVLLARPSAAIRAWRPRLHDLVAQALGLSAG